MLATAALTLMSQRASATITTAEKKNLTILKLKRVMWRVRKYSPDVKRPSYAILERAIMYECGTSRFTYHANRKALIKLGWIKSFSPKRFEVTNLDLEDG